LTRLKLFSGNANIDLAREICAFLSVPMGAAEVKRFSDGEINVDIGENVRGADVFIVQPTCPPVNDHLVELLEYIKSNWDNEIVLVSPDAGGVERARAFAKRLNATLAIIDKRRGGPNESQVMNIIGDVAGKTAVLLDDMVDTAGTVVQGAAALRRSGANRVFACATHPVLSGPSIERLEKSEIEQLVVTNTIPLGEKAACRKIRILSVASLLGEAIKRIHFNDSVSSLFV
jgi:ribose-phosphate pyrophosphokinase